VRLGCRRGFRWPAPPILNAWRAPRIGFRGCTRSCSTTRSRSRSALAPTRGAPTRLRVGSCVAVQFDGAHFLMSAHHVISRALAAVADEGAECSAGNVPVALTSATASLSNDELDIAPVRVTAQVTRNLESDDYRVVQPRRWPPAELEMVTPFSPKGFLAHGGAMPRRIRSTFGAQRTSA
jgi:hypothetical protein